MILGTSRKVSIDDVVIVAVVVSNSRFEER